jgi:class 3 adenylate cyclase
LYIGKPEQFQYLLHRTGEKKLQSLSQVVTKSLEGNVNAPDFLKTYGDVNITAYVGFIDLAGYSSAVKGKPPQEIADYLRPFLVGTIDILYDRSALIDKMIGDEIMFVLPETEESNNPGQIIFMRQILGALHDLAYKLELKYRYRIGLSYGKVNVFHLAGKGYSEWSIVGEPIHVAKRLHTVDQLSSPNPVCGAFGLSLNTGPLETLNERMKIILGNIAGFAEPFDHKIMDETKDFKGVGEVLWAYLFPKRPRSTQIRSATKPI